MGQVSTPDPGGTGNSPVPTADLDAEYRQAREECALFQPDDRAWFTVTGTEAGEFLQGQVTNEVEQLAPGEGCYALLLDRKGHIQTDMEILRIADAEFLIGTGAGQGPALLRHLSMYKIGRDVSVAETERDSLMLLGPASAPLVRAVPGPEHSFSVIRFAGADCLAVSVPGGVNLVCDPDETARIREDLVAAHAVPVSAGTVEILRVEAGRPRFGEDMSGASMPAEAGVVERAVNFEKGCYIGQEPVARLHYRGRPNRRLRGLRFRGPAAKGDAVMMGERELGTIGTAVVSPALGKIGLAILRREAEPGATVTVVSGDGHGDAEVVELPFSGAAS